MKVGDRPPAGQIEVTDGTHILDVNTSCDGVTGTTANNVVIFQTIAVKAGHMYQWIYDARKNPSADENLLITRADGRGFAPYFMSGDGYRPWSTRKSLVTASSDTMLIEFQDGGPNPGGFGPLIDNVRLYDLGKGP